MTKIISILFLLAVWQDEVPYKPANEFLVNIDLKFKEKPSGYGGNTYSNTGDRLDNAKGKPQAFLNVDISQLKLAPNEMRIMAINSEGKKILTKKTSPIPDLHFAMGFVDDLKSGAIPNQVTVFFLSNDKRELSKIIFGVLPNGVFQVNGEWHGQF